MVENSTTKTPRGEVRGCGTPLDSRVDQAVRRSRTMFQNPNKVELIFRDGKCESKKKQGHA